MKFLKNKMKYYFQSLLIILVVLSFLFSCDSTSTGPNTTTTTTTFIPPAPQVEEKDTLNGASIDLSEGAFELSNNAWGYPCNLDECYQAIILYTDGSYGWEWRRDTTNDMDPNYPEVICGTKPWGTQTQTSIFPIRIQDINSCNAEMDIVYGVTGDNWNFALEFWLTEQKPEGNNVSSSIIDEVMIWFGWGSTHDVVVIVEQDVITDGENIYDYAQYDPENEYREWDYHQFRISGGQRIPSTIDIKLFIDYIKDRYSRSDTLWVGGMELGNEYWDFTEGACTVNVLSYTVNGETATSGAD
jgi:chitinase